VLRSLRLSLWFRRPTCSATTLRTLPLHDRSRRLLPRADPQQTTRTTVCPHDPVPRPTARETLRLRMLRRSTLRLLHQRQTTFPATSRPPVSHFASLHPFPVFGKSRRRLQSPCLPSRKERFPTASAPTSDSRTRDRCRTWLVVAA